MPFCTTTCTLEWGLECRKSLIHPYPIYGLASLGQSSKNHLDKILILPKGALRVIYFADRRVHAIANVLPLSFLCYESVTSSMHDIKNNNAPSNILKLFHKTSSIHLYNTRSSTSGKLFAQSSRLEMQ